MPAAKWGCGTDWHREGGDQQGQVTGWAFFTLGQWSHGQKKVVTTKARWLWGHWGHPTFNSPPGCPLCPKSPPKVLLQQPQEEVGGSSKPRAMWVDLLNILRDRRCSGFNLDLCRASSWEGP